MKNLDTVTFDTEGQELYRQIVTKHAWLTHKASGGNYGAFIADEDRIF